jgi:hypothetical protein
MGLCASKKDYGFNEEAGREDWHKRKRCFGASQKEVEDAAVDNLSLR